MPRPTKLPCWGQEASAAEAIVPVAVDPRRDIRVGGAGPIVTVAMILDSGFSSSRIPYWRPRPS